MCSNIISIKLISFNGWYDMNWNFRPTVDCQYYTVIALSNKSKLQIKTAFTKNIINFVTKNKNVDLATRFAK